MLSPISFTLLSIIFLLSWESAHGAALVLNGKPAGFIPDWLVFYRFNSAPRNKEPDSQTLICGGTIVAHNIILTAARK